MASKESLELTELLRWAINRPELLDETFLNYDGWSQLTTLQCAKAKEVLFDEDRIDIIGQNGNEGEHYEVVGDE